MRRCTTVLFLLSVLVIPALILSVPAHSEVLSDFEANSEGWVLYGISSSKWNSTGGNPGGYLHIVPALGSSGPNGGMAAPAKFLGSWIGMQPSGTLSFDLYFKNQSNNSPGIGQLIRLAGPGGTAHCQLTGSGSQLIDGSWNHYVVPLEEFSWVIKSGTWQSILENVTLLHLKAEFVDGAEIVGFDNIKLSSDPSPAENPYEPDNSRSLASPIPIGQEYQNREIYPNNDVDWIKFDAVHGYGYVIDIVNMYSGNVRCRIYNENNNSVSAEISNLKQWTCPVTGTYYLRIWDDGANQSSAYKVRVLPSYWNGTASWDSNHEPDDARFIAHLNRTDGTVYHYEGNKAADNDWIRFSAEFGNTYTFTLSNETGGNYYFYVYDATASDMSGAKSTNWTWFCPVSGIYYVKIYENGADQAGSYDFSIKSNQTDYSTDILLTHAALYLDSDFGVDKYQLVASSSNCSVPIQWASENSSVVSVDTNGLLQAEDIGTTVVTASCPTVGTSDQTEVTVNADDYEPNNIQAEAKPIDIGRIYQSHILRPNGSEPDKYDWAKFDAVQGAGYVIELAKERGGDLRYHLYDEAGNRLLSSITTRVKWTCPVTGTYYLQMFEYGDDQWASYNVRVLPAYWNGSARWDGNQEPDESRYLANLLKTDGTVYHYANLNKADRDWARFTAKEGVTYTFALTNEAWGNYYFRVHDAHHTNFSGDKSTSWVWTCPATGTYFILLWEGGDNRIGSFDFSIMASELDNTVDIHNAHATLYLDPNFGVENFQLVANSSNCGDLIQWSSDNNSVVSVGSNGLLQAEGVGTAVVTGTCAADGTNDTVIVTVNADDHESNNVQSEARYIAVGQDYQSHIVRPNGSSPDKHDWVKFDAVQGYGYVMELANEQGGNIYFHFYDEAGNRLLTNINTRVNWTCPVTGTYYLQIFDSDNNQWASYNVRVLPAFWNAAAYWGSNQEPDNIHNLARLLKTDGTVYHYVNLANADRDWARFTAREGVSYTIALTNEAGGNYYFRVLDTYYTNFSGDKSTSWTWTCPATGTYFIMLWEGGDDRIGSFNFSITASEQDNTVDIHTTRATLYLDPAYGVDAYQLVAGSSNCNDQIQWSSSDGSVVSVDSNGMLQAVGEGTAVVTATCMADGTSDTSVVTVNADDHEPNNVQAEARYVAVGQDYQSHVVSPNGSNPDKFDWVKFEAVQGYGYVLELANELGGNVHFHFYDEAGNRLLTSIDTRASWTCPVTGAYFLQIFDYDHNQWASYDVRVLPAYWNGTAHWDINHEPDNSYYTANLLKTDGTAYHYANLSNSDRDCARFTAQKGVAYTFTLANEAGGNYYFRILDQEYTNFSGDKNTSWVWTCPATGTYFILLWEAGDDRVGSFDFSISSNRLDNTVDIHSTTATLYLDPVYGVNALQLFANSSNCSDQIQWSSSDGSVVSVDSNGLLQAEGTGTAVVKAVCLADGTNDTSVVTVNADAYEPNNVQAEARYITVGQDFQSHVVSPNGSNPDKHDWVKFDAVQGYGYVMELANELGGNIHFHFYDEAGNRLLTSINTRVNWTCPVTGTYYLQIFDYDNNQWASYNVRVLPAYWNGSASWGNTHEPDNTKYLARLIQTDGTLYHYANLNKADRDWVRFTAKEGVVYTIALSNEAGGNYYFRVYDAAYTNFSGDKNTSWVWTCPVTGTYFIQVWESGDDRVGSFDISISAGDAENTVDIQPTQVSLYSDPGYGVDSYQLTANSSNCSDQIQWDSSNSLVVSVNDNGEIQAVAPGSTVVSATCTADGTNDFVRVTVNADDYEPNNVQAQARYIAVGQGYQSHIVRPNGSNPDRNDWIKFDAVEGYGYVIELAHELGGNVYYKLYDEVGTILLSNIDALATWICPKTGTYYLRAFDYDHNQWSSFKIRVLPAYWNGNAAWDERYEPNDKWYAAYQIRTDGTVYHHENGTAIGDSVDWLRFTATEGQSYSFLLANELGGDFYFIVRNSSFTSLSGGRSSNWTWTCPKTETYFIGIYENGYDRIGSYDFSINSDPIDYSVDIPMDNVALYLDAEYGVTSYQLIANSSNGSDSIAWSSSDASIVAVDSNGMIQAIGAGLAVVTATCTIDGSFDQVAVTVSEVKDPDCSLYLDPLYGPISCQLASTCSGQIVWSSTDDTIASVDANGLVQSTGTGAVTITADCVEDGTDEEFFISVQTDNYENDDDQSQAGLIVVGNEYQSHLLTPNTDNPDVFDWLKFDAIEGYGYVIELAEVSGGAVRCQLYNEEGIPVSAAINTQAEWKCPVSGTYYVKVWESGNNQSASYKIRVLPAYWNGTGVWDSNYEPDNNHYNAFLVETDGTLYHHENINPKDYDAIRFSALEGQTYTISLSDEVGGNYFFSLYDSRFRDILGNQSTSVSWICPVTGTYYVLIWENGTDRSGVYDFSITADVTDYTVDIPNDRVTLYLESSWGVSSYQLAANSSNCSDQIQWSSSDIAVVSVDANGLLQAQGAGRSVISATCSIDGSSDELTVTVNADDYESNDFQVLAKPVLVGQNYQSHQLRPNAAVPDVYDWVKFDAVEGYGYVIEVANETAGDVRFNMFNENGNSLLNGVSSRSEWTCPVSGKYFLQIYENNNDHWTSYQLRVLPSYWNGTAEWGADHEPDDGLYIAEQIKTDGTVYHYANSNPADVDWVRFLAREGNTYTFLQTNELRGDFVFMLFDSRYRSISGWVNNSLAWVCPVTGSYFVQLAEGNNNRIGSFDFSITVDTADEALDIPISRVSLYLDSSSGASTYQLVADSTNCSDQIQWSSSDAAVAGVDAAGLLHAEGAGTAVIAAACPVDGSSDEVTVTVNADDYENNDVQVLAKPILVGNTYQSHLLRPNAAIPDLYDWVKFEAVEGYGYVIELANETAGDVRFNLFNENGNSLLSGVSVRNEWTCPVSGTYYLQLYENGNDHWTSYQVRVLPAYWNVVAERGVDHEPDNGPFTAEQIKTDGTVYHYANDDPADADWVRFTALEGSTYTFLQTNELRGNFYFRLFDGLSTDIGGWRNNSWAWVCPVTGTYYVQMVEGDSNRIGSFDFSITADAADNTVDIPTGRVTLYMDSSYGVSGYQLVANSSNCSDPIQWSSSDSGVVSVDADGLLQAAGAGTAVITAACTVDGSSDDVTVTVNADDYENSDVQVLAKPIVVGNTYQSHLLRPNAAIPDLYDWVKFEAVEGYGYVIELANETAGDVRCHLYDQSGNSILTNIVHQTEWLCPKSGTYYLWMFENGNDQWTSYQVRVLPAYWNSSAVWDDNYEPNDLAYISKPIATDNILKHAYNEQHGDIDWYRFSAGCGYEYTISLINEIGGNFHFRLYDQNLAPLGSNQTAGWTWSCPSPGLYHVKVWEANADQLGSYDLSVKGVRVDVDSDNDGMHDYWEETHGLDPESSSDAGLDDDEDGMTNLQEHDHLPCPTDPNNPDTDGDYMPDGWEVEHGFDPLNDDAGYDLDGDNASNLFEYETGKLPDDPSSVPSGFYLDKGLVAYYPFNANFEDASGRGNHGSGEGGLTTVEDRFGDSERSFYFDGVNDRIRIPASVANTAFLTFNVWLKTSDTNFGILTGSKNNQDNEFLIDVYPNNPANALSLHHHGTKKNTTVILNDDKWHMLTVVVAPGSTIIYLDGKFVQSLNSGAGSGFTIQGLWLGAEQDCVNGCWQTAQQYSGILDDIRIYKRVLDDKEVELLYSIEGEIDSDNDGMPSWWEEMHDLNPLDPNDANVDSDGDGLPNFEEFNNNTNPTTEDTDGDRLPDRWEVDNNTDPRVNDAAKDPDDDDCTNFAEFKQLTDPNNPDTDGDGLDDCIDPNPLAPTSSLTTDTSDLTLSPGARATAWLAILNSHLQVDRFDLTVAGIPSHWYNLFSSTVTVIKGEKYYLPLHIQVPETCDLTQIDYDVQISAVSARSGSVANGGASVQMHVAMAPAISDLLPQNDELLATNSVQITWRTDSDATTEIYYRKVGDSTYQQAVGEPGKHQQHRVLLNDLTWDETYEWYARSEGDCQDTASEIRRFTVQNAVVFVTRNFTHEILRDYNREISVAIENRDIAEHAVRVKVSSSDDELIAGFVGSGSIDETLVLPAGESASLNLVTHAQDTTQDEYALTFKLIADAEAGNPIVDYARSVIQVTDPDFNLAVEETGSNPSILTNIYRITNNGDTITDLSVVAPDDVSSQIVFQPKVDHLRLKRGQSIDFAATFQATAAMAQWTGQLIARGAGSETRFDTRFGCAEGKSLFEVALADASVCMKKASWYCTNRPRIRMNLDVPPGVTNAEIQRARLYINFSLKKAFGTYRKHDVIIKFNGVAVDSILDTIPVGPYGIEVPPALIHTGIDGIGRNEVTLETSHMNGGHYAIASDIQLILDIDSLKLGSVCATSQAEADQLAQDIPYVCDGTPEWQPFPRPGSVAALDEDGNPKPNFSPGETTQLQLTLNNPDLEEHSCSLTFQIDDDFNDVVPLYEQEYPFTIPAGGNQLVPFWWTLPTDTALGFYHVKTIVSCPGDEDREFLYRNVIAVYRPSPAYSVAPEFYNFGDVGIGIRTEKLFTVTNTGDLTLDMGDIAVSGDPAFFVTQDNCSQFSLAKLESCSFNLIFEPQSAGEKIAILSVPADGSQTDIPVSGSGTTDDRDNDGMPDDWEIRYGLNPDVNDANEDPDNDRLINRDEYKYHTHPGNYDTDGDGGPDLYVGLAKHYSPIVYQHVDVSDAGDGFEGYADLITNFNYDGNWNGNEKWENLEGFIRQNSAKAAVYYSVVETTNYWFIYYGLYHPRDWTNLAGDLGDIFAQHENDLEAVTLMVNKGAGYPGNIIAAMSMSHNVWLEYVAQGIDGLDPAHYSGDERGWSAGLKFKEHVAFKGEHSAKESIHNGNHPRIYIQSKGHGIFMDADSDSCLNAGATDPGDDLEGESIIGHWYLTGFPGDEGYNGTGVVYYCSYKDDGETVSDINNKIIDSGSPEYPLGADVYPERWIKYQLIPMSDLTAKRFWIAGNKFGNDEMYAIDKGGYEAFYGDTGAPNAAHPPWTIPDYNYFDEGKCLPFGTSQNSPVTSPGEIFGDPLLGFSEHFNFDPDNYPLPDLANEEYLYNPYDSDLGDKDRDGMPDDWEIRYGLNPDVDDADEDPDNDGSTNIEEYRHGTNPIVAASVHMRFTEPDVTVSLTGDNRIFFEVTNLYPVPKAVQLSIIGIDSSWYTLDDADQNILLLPFGKRKLTAQLHLPDNCDIAGQHPFSISAHWAHGSDIASATADSTLIITPNPNIYRLSIPDETQMAGNNILVAWRTDIPTDGTVFYRQAGEDEWIEVDAGAGLTEHRVTLSDLEFFTLYEYYTESRSVCNGLTTTELATVKTGKAVKFVDAINEFWVDRDYKQIVQLTITNTDTIQHTFDLSVINSSEDIVIDFVGDGSNGREATLEAGESVQVELAVHAAEATRTDYDIYLKLVSDQGEFDSFVDYSHAIVHVRPFVANLDLQPVVSTPGMMTYRYRLINYGDTLGDIEVFADDDSRMKTWMIPEIHHYRLENGDYIEFDIHAQEHTTGTVYARSGGYVVSASFEIGCPEGTFLKTYPLTDVPVEAQIKDWYCTNKNVVELPFAIPKGIQLDGVAAAMLELNFSLPMSYEKYDPHNLTISVNDRTVVALENIIPEGVYEYRIPVDFLKFGHESAAKNYLTLVADGIGAGQYIVATDFRVKLNVDQMEIDLCVPPPQEEIFIPPVPETKIVSVGPNKKFRPGDMVTVYVELYNNDQPGNIHLGTLTLVLENDSNPDGHNPVRRKVELFDLKVVPGPRVVSHVYQIPETADDIDYTISATFKNLTMNASSEMLNRKAFFVRTPIVIVHGIGGSEMAEGHSGKKVFDPVLVGASICDNRLNYLICENEAGDPIDNDLCDVYPTLPIKRYGRIPIPGTNGIIFGDVFQGFENHLRNRNYNIYDPGTGAKDLFDIGNIIINTKKTEDVFYFVYDWRHSNPISSAQLEQYIANVVSAIQVAEGTGYDKINIVAHSMGGLITKHLLKVNSSIREKVRKTFFVGTPNMGSVDAFSTIKHGLGNANRGGIVPLFLSEELERLIGKLNDRVDELSLIEGWADGFTMAHIFDVVSRLISFYEAFKDDGYCNEAFEYYKLLSSFGKAVYGIANPPAALSGVAAALSEIHHLVNLDKDVNFIRDFQLKKVFRELSSVYQLLPTDRYLTANPDGYYQLNHFEINDTDLITRHLTTWHFNIGDFIDPVGLALTLRDQPDKVSAIIYSLLSAATATSLAGYDGSLPLPRSLYDALLEDFNSILISQNLYVELPISEMYSEDEKQRIDELYDQGTELVQINRLLIQDAFSGKISRREIYSQQYLEDSQSFHEEIDSITNQELSANSYSIVGCKKCTAEKLIEKENFHSLQFLQGDGDGTVLLDSALDIDTDRKYVARYAKHRGLTSSEGVKLLIGSILKGYETDFEKDIFNSVLEVSDEDSAADACGVPVCQSGVRIDIPLPRFGLPEIRIKRVGGGNGTSSFSPNGIHLGTLGSDFVVTNEGVQVYVPAGAIYTLEFKGVDKEYLSVKYNLMSEGGILKTYIFKDLTIDLGACGQITFDLTNAMIDPVLRFDQDCNGTYDTEDFQPSDVLDENEANDFIAPVTTALINGTEGENGWYTSDVTVTLNAADEGGSGLWKTRYRLSSSDYYTESEYDGADTGSVVFTISDPGEYTVYYHSIDRNLNREIDHILEIKIDDVVPIVKNVKDEGVFNLGTSTLSATLEAQTGLSGLRDIRYSLGSAPGLTDVLDSTSAGSVSNFQITGLSLSESCIKKIYINVQATNGAGVSGNTASSDGIIILEPGGDPDADTFINEDEMAAGSNPCNELSIPKDTTTHLKKGFNLISIPAEVMFKPDLNDWLHDIGTIDEIEKIMVYDKQAGQFLIFTPGNASNPGYPLQGGEALIVYARQDKEIIYTSALCETHDFKQGFNAVGIACPPDGYSVFQLLNALGPENAATIQRYDAKKGIFESAGFNEADDTVGIDFPILPGNGFLIYLTLGVENFKPE